MQEYLSIKKKLLWVHIIMDFNYTFFLTLITKRKMNLLDKKDIQILFAVHRRNMACESLSKFKGFHHMCAIKVERNLNFFSKCGFIIPKISWDNILKFH
jgi:hypothetical protein